MLPKARRVPRPLRLHQAGPSALSHWLLQAHLDSPPDNLQEMREASGPFNRNPRQVDELLQDEQEPGRDREGNHL